MRSQAFTLLEVIITLCLVALFGLLLSSLLTSSYSLYQAGINSNQFIGQIAKIEGMLANTLAYQVPHSQREHHVGQKEYLVFTPYDEKLIFHQDSFDEARELLTLTSSSPSFHPGHSFTNPYPSLSQGSEFFVSNLEEISTLYESSSASKKLIDSKTSTQIQLASGFEDVFSNDLWHQGYIVRHPYALCCDLSAKTLTLYTHLSSYTAISSTDLPDLNGATATLIVDNIEQCSLSEEAIVLSLSQQGVSSPYLIKPLG